MDDVDPALVEYLKQPAPHMLEIGAGQNGKPGWLATDLYAGVNPAGLPVIALDACKEFPIPSDSFDFVYSEHMIEHIDFFDGQNMLAECHRVLKPGGIIRIVTPSLGFLFRVSSADRGALEERYRQWSVRSFVPDAPSVTNAFFVNNFMRAWGHRFIYDHETLGLSMALAGFRRLVGCDLNASEHPPLRGLENESRLPRGFLDLESMVLEGVKEPAPAVPGRNLSLGKPATQSSVSPWSRGDTPEQDAGRLVSGTLTGEYNCHTALEDQPWWRVDLEAPCHIRQIRLYNRTADRDIMRRASRFRIQVSDDDLNWQTIFQKNTLVLFRGTRHSPFVWSAEQKILARYVRIQLLDRQFLHLDQVEIFGDEAV